jgi:lantibiotic modifying enzyme
VAFQDSSALALAVQHGEHILRSAEELPSGLAWKETNSAHLTGFAHGAAGIAYALGCLFRESSEERFRNVAMEALRFERSTFNEQTQNWKDNRDWVQRSGNAETGTVTWCTGAPGIGMSRLGLSDIWQDAWFADEIAAAFRTTQKRLESDDDCICHGGAGNLEFLNDVCRKMEQSEWIQESHSAIHRFLHRIAANGFSFEGNVERLSLMTGLAGCGYTFLRLIEPDAVPSILLLRPPTSVALHVR